jgi:FkbM family methyltransferase
MQGTSTPLYWRPAIRNTYKLLNVMLASVGLKLIRANSTAAELVVFKNASTAPQKALGNNSASDSAEVPFGMVVPSVYGPIIVNRHDINQTGALVTSGKAYNHNDIEMLCGFLRNCPEGAVCLDIGANFGLYSLAFARCLRLAGGVCHAFEAQRIIADMIGGTAALNGIENLYVHHVAIGEKACSIPIPSFDYNKELNFGSIEFGPEQREPLSQQRIERTAPDMVKQVRVDDLDLKNVILMKIDIEGMEEKAIEGATDVIARDLPVLFIEWKKSDKDRLVGVCKSFGYEVFQCGYDLLCVHPSRKAQYEVRIDLPRL